MRYAILVFLLLSVCCQTCFSADDGGEELRTIFMETNPGPYDFGTPVILTVSYRNRGTDLWEIPGPMESVQTIVKYNLVGSNEQAKGQSLGRMTFTTITDPDGYTTTAGVIPSPKPVSIAPGESYEFEVIVEPIWTGHLVPGSWQVWVQDGGLGLTSNKVDIPLFFTATSMRACFQKVLDEKLHRYERKFYSEWIEKVIPTFDVRWSADETPEQERQEIELEIKEEVESAKAYFSDPSNAQAIESAIAEINKAVSAADPDAE